MKKRMITAFLALCMALTVLPVTIMAASGDEVEQIISDTRKSYVDSRIYSGRSSFNGYCGMMVGYQMWSLGITDKPVTLDGNAYYNYYRPMTKTSEGYYVRPYGADSYTLTEALNAISQNGTQDVYNILVSFQWTNTEAGASCGHCCFINAILDGKVYFVESFQTMRGGREGNVISCTIPEFNDLYDDWTVFGGVVYFGLGGYDGICTHYGTDLFVRTRFDITMRSMPCLLGENDCHVVRSVAAGERLHVTAVVENDDGELYYRVTDNETVGYVVAQSTTVIRVNDEGLKAEELSVPDGVRKTFSGTVSAENGRIGAVEAVLTDSEGRELLRRRAEVDAQTVPLDEALQDVQTPALSDGSYIYSLYAETSSPCVRDGVLDYAHKTALLEQRQFSVGEEKHIKIPQTGNTRPPDGWVYENGTWYCYRDGKPRTGWVEDLGVRYYLREDGAVTTGDAVVEGINYHFSGTGALCTGWLETPAGMRYCWKDGQFADGWQRIGAGRYHFENGILVEAEASVSGFPQPNPKKNMQPHKMETSEMH